VSEPGFLRRQDLDLPRACVCTTGRRARQNSFSFPPSPKEAGNLIMKANANVENPEIL
jgi:hypothetical protein